MKKCAVGLAVMSVGSLAAAQNVYPNAPQWTAQSGPTNGVAVAVGDIDGNGRLDLVVGSRVIGKLLVYHNWTGAIQRNPTWTSTDDRVFDQLLTADVNGDGWVDVVGAGSLPGGTSGQAFVYINNNGVLPTTASWSSTTGWGSSCALGDVNLDGRLDLAVTAFSDNTNRLNSLYINQGGSYGAHTEFSTSNISSGWWLDETGDGKLDLATAMGFGNSHVFVGNGSGLGSWSSWQPLDCPYPVGLIDADMNRDGRRDLLIADSRRDGFGTKTLQLYLGRAGGSWDVHRSWSSTGYDTGGTPADINHDGWLDVCGGYEFGMVYYLNTPTGLPASPDWVLASSGWFPSATQIVDMNRNGIRRETAVFPAQGSRRLFYLPRQPVEGVHSVEVDGVALTKDRYCWNARSGWVTVGVTPVKSVRVNYEYSLSLDFVVGRSAGLPVWIFYNQLGVPCGADFDADGFVTGVDFDLFVGALESGNTAADFDGDGFVTGADFDAYVVAFEAGC